MSAFRTIPQSTALTEALPDSLSELFSRDPEGYQQQDLEKIIGFLRSQRERMQAAEAAGQRAGTRGKTTLVAGASAAELDL